MNNLIRGKEQHIYEFTNLGVEKLQMIEGFNSNYIAKALIGHIDTYKLIIDNLLEQNKRLEKLLDEDIESRR